MSGIRLSGVGSWGECRDVLVVGAARSVGIARDQT
jgi:hypothetical protein